MLEITCSISQSRSGNRNPCAYVYIDAISINKEEFMFTLPELSYAYDALEPYIDARTMEIHHSKHHNGYVTKLKAAGSGEKSLE